jgi:hypothetical protein
MMDLGCAETVIADLVPGDLDANALGAFLIVRGDLASLNENFAVAENAYQNVLEIPELHT